MGDKKVYHKSVSRHCSLFDIRAWYEGESKELEKWIGFGFYNTIFISENSKVTIYYEKEECDKFDKILDEKLTEELFNNLCDNLFEIIGASEDVKSNEEIYNLSVKSWPTLTIFDEVSKYPEYATDPMLLRLIRVRKETEAFPYELSRKAERSKKPTDYIFFKNNLITIPAKEFMEQNNIVIEEIEWVLVKLIKAII